jgi:type I restriction enzyme, S subunit
VRTEWERTTLGKVASFKGGGTPSTEKSAYWNGDIPWVSPKDMKSSEVGDSIDKITMEAIENSAASLIPKDAVLIVVRSGILARTIPVAITTRPLAVNQDIKALCPNKDIEPHYLHYFMQMSESHILNLVTRGATVHRLSTNSLRALPFLKPPLPEQRHIVAILDEAFAGLASATANAKKNINNARELFESYLSLVFRKKGKSWTEKTLGAVCQFQGGSQPPKSKFSPERKTGYVRLIQIRDYKSDKFAVYIPRSLTKKFCTANDVMIGRYGPPLFQILRGLEGAYNVALMKAAPNEQVLSKDFLFYFLKNNDILSYIVRSSSRAAGQSGLNKETIEPYRIAFPPLPEQAEIVETVRKRGEECERLQANYEQKLAALNELKQSILQKAFSGELSSPPLQAIKEAAE